MESKKIQHIIFDFDGVLTRWMTESELPFNMSEKLNTEIIDWIRAHKSEFTFSILSNNSPMLPVLLREKYGVSNDFSHVFNSAEIGFFKPDPQIFVFALNELEAKPEECFFIDDRSENVESARALGMEATLYTSNEKLLSELNAL